MSTSVVFFDPRAPELARLLDGLRPGARGFVIDPARDGLRQVAEIIDRELLSDLTDLSLVAHGRPGALEFGAHALDAKGLATHAAVLAEIGAALAPAGAVRIYACDLASGTEGRQFLAFLSRALGDAAVAAATHPVGAAGAGGSWMLDAGVGTVAPGTPFTLAAQQSYRSLLAVKFTKGPDTIGDTGPFDSRMVFGDFDGDGDVDILYQNGNVAGVGIGYKQNLGNGTFRDFADARAAGTPFTGFDFTNQQISSSFLFAVDLNNDGRMDIVDRSNNAFQYWQQQSNGTFVKVLPDPIGDTGLFDSRMVFGDFDGDGDVDILYQNGNAPGVGIGYKQNLGNGTFRDFADARAAGTPFAGFDFTGQQISSSFLFAVDLNNDGRVDIVDRSNSALQYWQQQSNGTFVKVLPDPIGDTGPFDSRMVFGDFDGDGDVDILYQNGNVAGVGIGYKQNLGNGTFQDFADARAAGTPFAGFDFTNQQISSSFLFAVDIDHDGDVDLVDRSNGATQVWIQGSDTGGDGSPPTLVATNPTDNATGISRTASIVLTFDEAVFAGSGNIRIVRIADRSVVETIAVSGGAVSIAGSTVTIAHGALAANTGYAIQIDQGAFVDSDGVVYAGIRGTDFTTLNFTTIATQPPVLTATSGSTAASEQIAVPIDPGIIVTDPDSTTLASATVAITGNFRSGQDVLAFANMSTAIYGNVVGTYNGATGVLTLTSSGATATLAQFQAVLRSVTCPPSAAVRQSEALHERRMTGSS